MAAYRLKKGLDLPINGKPLQEVSESKRCSRVALVGDDYVGMKPTMIVKTGDFVKLGQVLFTDKKLPDVKYTAPGCGKVIEINRGEKRAFKSLVIKLSGNEEITFNSYNEPELTNLSNDQVKENLINSGLWTAIRVRPFSRVANPANSPHSIFITAMDTNPLAPSLEKIISENERNFTNGITVISKLTEGKVYLCRQLGADIPSPDSGQISVEEFSGPHPAGNAGTHIHFIDPVHRTKIVWYLNAQDVIAIGHLFTTGKILTDRVISLAGASVKKPRLIKTRIGADLGELTNNELLEGENRIISGSVLSGRHAYEQEFYLGRFHQQVSVIKEDRKRVFFGWLIPSTKLYSVKNIVLSKLFPKKTFDFSTAVHGGKRAIVPSGNFEALMPLDLMPTYLLRSLAVYDLEEAEKLGALELDEEDLSLCTFSCPSKQDYGTILRENLTIIEKEG